MKLLEAIKKKIARICYYIYVQWSGEFDDEYKIPEWLKGNEFKDINRKKYNWWK